MLTEGLFGFGIKGVKRIQRVDVGNNIIYFVSPLSS